MGSKLDAMRKAAKGPPEHPPIAVPTVTVPEKRPPKVKKALPTPQEVADEFNRIVGVPVATVADVTILPSPPKKKKGKTPLEARGRLPDGSSVEAKYTAIDEQNGYWVVAMTIAGGPVLTIRKGGLFQALAACDRMYRDHLRKLETPEPEAKSCTDTAS